MRTPMPALLLAFLMTIGLTTLAGPTLAPAEDPPAAEDAPEEGIPWVTDYEEGKTKAEEAKKGLLVYLTPSWFT